MTMILDAFVGSLISRLSAMLEEKVVAVLDAKRELQKLQRKMKRINLVLRDAERKRIQSEVIAGWVKELKDVVYDADDIIDLCRYEGSRLLGDQPSSSSAPSVMLLGHSDSYARDKAMQVTITFNHFGEGLIQRLPRCRHGYFHVVNNDYTHWEMYAIGGSADPTINSQGNRYLAPVNSLAKEVTKRVVTDNGIWKSWNWRSEGDLLLNGAYFTPSGAGAFASYSRASSLGAKPSSMVSSITSGVGGLGCRKHAQC